MNIEGKGKDRKEDGKRLEKDRKENEGKKYRKK